jgi:hypothetical protein
MKADPATVAENGAARHLEFVAFRCAFASFALA